ncbi:MAG TPA: STAS domain-containing protein [Aeromicrobium sp.]|nr:STAS domain-containing protein [Aeromicrobium sp.]HKY57165.1 STAS domain-containing protein [Aeromicrobium sp.]
MPEFDEHARGTVGVLRVAGEIDMASADELRDRLLACLERFESVEVDLGGVTFIDSSGLAALVRLRTESEMVGKAVALVKVSPAMARLLELTGLQGLFDVNLPRS